MPYSQWKDSQNQLQFRLHLDADKLWRWDLVKLANGAKLAISGEGFATAELAKQSIARLKGLESVKCVTIQP